MLTGDSSSAGAEVGRKLGLDEVFSGLMPAGKLEHVRRLKPEEGLLAFVGDGMNDAPSLAAADIGIAMGGVGSDTALQAADVVVMKGDPVAVPQGMVLSRGDGAHYRAEHCSHPGRQTAGDGAGYSGAGRYVGRRHGGCRRLPACGGQLHAYFPGKTGRVTEENPFTPPPCSGRSGSRQTCYPCYP